jgi:K+-transporting ATPase KdpF subunit
MNAVQVLAAVCAVGLFVYLIVALVRAEDF